MVPVPSPSSECVPVVYPRVYPYTSLLNNDKVLYNETTRRFSYKVRP